MATNPEIIAHRGVPRELPENTLPSFQRALEQRADGIELDVHKTRDGVIVVHHDPVVNIVDGSGAIVRKAIADLDSTENLNAALPDAGRLPTLDAVLDLVGSRAAVYVEAKAPGTAELLVACFERHPEVRVAVHSFDHRIPLDVRRLRPGIDIGLLSCSYSVSLTSTLAETRPNAFWQSADLIDKQLVNDAHAMGARVIAWTVNDPDHARRLLALGVDGLCTDQPGALRSAIAPSQ